MTATHRLLELAAQAAGTNDPDTLHELLLRGHQLWCEGLAQVQADLRRDTAGMDDGALRTLCSEHDAPWPPDAARAEAISGLAFALWDATPAALAFVDLEAHAAEVGGTCLLGEEIE